MRAGVQKELDQYARPDAHVRGAIYANRYLKTNFGQGSKPKHVYISHVRDTYPQTDVICFEYGGEVPGCFVVDMDVMQKKRVPRTVKTGDRRTRLELDRARSDADDARDVWDGIKK